MNLRAQITALAATDEAIWALNFASTSPADQLLRSTDGVNFSPYDVAASHEKFGSPARNLLVMSGSRSGEVHVISLIGPPLVHRVWPPARRREISIAYSRTALRSETTEVDGPYDDSFPYSLPARDLLGLPDGGLAVLRNREDVRGSTGRLEVWKGRRADRYDGNGHQLATASFPRAIHWLVNVTDKAVSGISNRGEMLDATWGPAIRGEIIKP